MTPPLSLCPQGKKLVCRLYKSPFGLKEAHQNWFTNFFHTIKKAGLVQSHLDYSLIVKTKTLIYNCGAYLCRWYIVITTWNEATTIQSIKQFFYQQFRIKDLHLFKYFLDWKLQGLKQVLSFFNKMRFRDHIWCWLLGCSTIKFFHGNGYKAHRLSSWYVIRSSSLQEVSWTTNLSHSYKTRHYIPS